MNGEDLVGSQGRRRARRRCALLEPLEDVTAADHDYDDREPTILRQHPLEDHVELSRRHARAADVSHVYSAGAEGAEILRNIEDPLQRSGPARVLIEREALDGAPPRGEHPKQPGLALAHVAPPLAVRVHVEAHAPVEVRANRPIGSQVQPGPGRPHVVARVPPNPPAPGQLGRDPYQGRAEHDPHPPGGHGAPPRWPTNRLRRST